MTEPNEFGDRWCCEECKRLAEAAADETLAAAKLSIDEEGAGDRDPMRGRFRNDPTAATVIVVACWLILACLFAGTLGLLAKLYPDSQDIALLPYALVGVLAYCGWLCWRYRQFLVDGRDYPWRRR